jgi:hypothetical protein
MVIVSTYLIFVSGSVAICRVLQKNKKYYYKIVPSKGVNATIGVIRFSKKK